MAGFAVSRQIYVHMNNLFKKKDEASVQTERSRNQGGAKSPRNIMFYVKNEGFIQVFEEKKGAQSWSPSGLL